MANIFDNLFQEYVQSGETLDPSLSEEEVKILLEDDDRLNPEQRAVLMAMFHQESQFGSDPTMQINPLTGKAVSGANNLGISQIYEQAWQDASRGMHPGANPYNAFDNAQAGINYFLQGYGATGGNLKNTLAYYNQGPSNWKKDLNSTFAHAAAGQTTQQYADKILNLAQTKYAPMFGANLAANAAPDDTTNPNAPQTTLKPGERVSETNPDGTPKSKIQILTDVLNQANATYTSNVNMPAIQNALDQSQSFVNPMRENADKLANMNRESNAKFGARAGTSQDRLAAARETSNNMLAADMENFQYLYSKQAEQDFKDNKFGLFTKRLSANFMMNHKYGGTDASGVGDRDGNSRYGGDFLQKQEDVLRNRIAGGQGLAKNQQGLNEGEIPDYKAAAGQASDVMRGTLAQQDLQNKIDAQTYGSSKQRLSALSNMSDSDLKDFMARVDSYNKIAGNQFGYDVDPAVLARAEQNLSPQDQQALARLRSSGRGSTDALGVTPKEAFDAAMNDIQNPNQREENAEVLQMGNAIIGSKEYQALVQSRMEELTGANKNSKEKQLSNSNYHQMNPKDQAALRRAIEDNAFNEIANQFLSSREMRLNTPNGPVASYGGLSSKESAQILADEAYKNVIIGQEFGLGKDMLQKPQVFIENISKNFPQDQAVAIITSAYKAAEKVTSNRDYTKFGVQAPKKYTVTLAIPVSNTYDGSGNTQSKIKKSAVKVDLTDPTAVSAVLAQLEGWRKTEDKVKAMLELSNQAYGGGNVMVPPLVPNSPGEASDYAPSPIPKSPFSD